MLRAAVQGVLRGQLQLTNISIISAYQVGRFMQGHAATKPRRIKFTVNNMAEAEVKGQRLLKGKQAGVIINGVLTEEDVQKPIWDEYKNARAKGKPAYFVQAKLSVDDKPWSPRDAKHSTFHYFEQIFIY